MKPVYQPNDEYVHEPTAVELAWARFDQSGPTPEYVMGWVERFLEVRYAAHCATRSHGEFADEPQPFDADEAAHEAVNVVLSMWRAVYARRHETTGDTTSGGYVFPELR